MGKNFNFKYLIGGDNGFTGAFSVLELETGELVDVVKMPTVTISKKLPVLNKQGKTKTTNKDEIDETALRDFFKKYSEHGFHLVLEKASVMPKQGIVSSGRYMCSYGIVRGICVGVGGTYELVHPAVWKKKMLTGVGNSKGTSILKVKQLFPNAYLRENDKCRVDDHNMADAVLIGEYGRRSMLGLLK